MHSLLTTECWDFARSPEALPQMDWLHHHDDAYATSNPINKYIKLSIGSNLKLISIATTILNITVEA